MSIAYVSYLTHISWQNHPTLNIPCVHELVYVKPVVETNQSNNPSVDQSAVYDTAKLLWSTTPITLLWVC